MAIPLFSSRSCAAAFQISAPPRSLSERAAGWMIAYWPPACTFFT
jgi:hypothetical protein